MQYENDGITEEKEHQGLTDFASSELQSKFRDQLTNKIDDEWKKFADQKSSSNSEPTNENINSGFPQTTTENHSFPELTDANGTSISNAGEKTGELAENASKLGNLASTATTAGTAATGVGAPLAAAMKLYNGAKAINNSAKSATQKGTLEDDYRLNNSSVAIISILLFIIIYIIIYCGSLIQWITPGPVEKYRESQFPSSDKVKMSFLKDDFPTVKKVLQNYNGLEEYDKDQLNKNAIDLYQKLIDASISDVFRIYAQKIINNYDLNILQKFFTGQLRHHTNLTLEEFRKQPYPYSKKKPNGSFYTIGEFLDGVPIKNNDINYAEIMAIFSMSEDFQYDADANTLERFARLLCSDKAKQLLYEYTTDIVYIVEAIEHEYTIEIEIDGEIVEETQTYITYERTGYYYTFNVRPYGLRELYAIAGVNMDAKDKTFKKYSNKEMLDKKETYLRTFARDALYTIGTAYNEPRDAGSYAFSLGTTTGRSPYYYIADADNYKGYGEKLEEWDDENLPQNPFDITYSSGSKIIDMPYYINQGDYPDIKRGNSSTTVKSSGCIDCCYIMIADYYTGQNISVSSIATDSSMYDGSNFYSSVFLNRYNMSFGSNISFNIDSIRSYIDKGMPVMLHIEGKWTHNGITYHSSGNGHFLVIMGYDDTGFYVYDPGSRNNTTNGPIPYEAFYYVDGKYIRTPYKDGFIPRFK